MESRLSEIENRVTRLETKVDDVREDIKEIKESQKQNVLWVIGTLTTALLTLGVLLFKG